MEYWKVSRAEVDEMVHQANTERAVRAAATRRVCRWLDRLYNLEDPRGQTDSVGCVRAAEHGRRRGPLVSARLL